MPPRSPANDEVPLRSKTRTPLTGKVAASTPVVPPVPIRRVPPALRATVPEVPAESVPPTIITPLPLTASRPVPLWPTNTLPLAETVPPVRVMVPLGRK